MELVPVKIITPDRVFYEGDVSMIEFTSSEGDLGIYPRHVAMTVIVAPGMLILHEENGTKKAALHAGFAEILPDKITILAEVAEWPDEIDKNRAEEARIRAERRLAAPDGIDVARAELALSKALLRLKVIQ